MDRKLEKMKKDYLNIPIPNELEKQTHKSIKRYRTLRSVSKNAIFLAASILLFITTVNISPAAASTLSDIPFLNKVIKVVTITEWKETKENNQLDIKTPEVTGLKNKTLSQTLNQQYVQESKSFILNFNKKQQMRMETTRSKVAISLKQMMICYYRWVDIRSKQKHLLQNLFTMIQSINKTNC